MGWTSERIYLLTKWWGDGLATVEIGSRLGMSKNAVIGKAHRIGLETHVRSVQSENFKAKTKKRPRPSLGPKRRYEFRSRRAVAPYAPKPTPAPAIPVVQEEEPIPLMVLLFDIERGQCKWPHGDPKEVDFGFCGHEQEYIDNPWRPYCAFHRKLGTRKDFRYGRKVR